MSWQENVKEELALGNDRAAEIEAVMDAVGFGRAVIFGVSEGGPAAMVFAATRPERARRSRMARIFNIPPVANPSPIPRKADRAGQAGKWFDGRASG